MFILIVVKIPDLPVYAVQKERKKSPSIPRNVDNFLN
jgi:hypothetical protein